MGRQPDFEILEHTADAGIIAHGSTLEDVFSHAAQGMYSLMVDLRDVREVESRDIHVEAADVSNLLSSWLVELLFLTETDSLLFRRFDLEIQGKTLRARAYGERVDPSRHRLGGAGRGVRAPERSLPKLARGPASQLCYPSALAQG